MDSYRRGVKEGMTVRSLDGEKLGEVLRCDDERFLIEKGLFFPVDYVARYDQIFSIREGEIVLEAKKAELRELHGKTPGVSPYSEQATRRVVHDDTYDLSLRDQIDDRMPVSSSDGHRLGQIVRTDERYFVVEKGIFFKRDFAVRYEDVADIRRGVVCLALTRAELMSGGREVSLSLRHLEEDRNEPPPQYSRGAPEKMKPREARGAKVREVADASAWTKPAPVSHHTSRQVEDGAPSVTFPPFGTRIDTRLPPDGEPITAQQISAAGTRVDTRTDPTLSGPQRYHVYETVIESDDVEHLDLRTAHISHREIAVISGPLPMVEQRADDESEDEPKRRGPSDDSTPWHFE